MRFTVPLLFLASFSPALESAPAPDLLTYDDLIALSSSADVTPELQGRLDRLLSTPFVRNTQREIPSQKAPVTVAFWNIERGREWKQLTRVLSNPGHVKVTTRNGRRGVAELRALAGADIVILNEVDFGMKRTGYADVAAELASSLRMNHAFAVEFVEIDNLYFGTGRIELTDRKLSDALADDLKVDPLQYRGLHGNAILSRYPIRAARVNRLEECYGWFDDEVKAINALEKGRRWSAKRLFEERIRRQVRRGGRMALIVELEVPEAPGGILTVVSTHLEDRSTPSCRQKQLAGLLDVLAEVDGPLVLGGDLNTTGGDGTPTSFQHEVMKRVSDTQFWARNAIRWFSPLTIPYLAVWPINHFKNFQDPSAMSFPLLGPNRERATFTLLRGFRFADGGAFDFSGNGTRSGNGRSGTLANSNQRAFKGFKPTFRFQRNYFGLVGTFRLDWLLVKPDGLDQLRPHSPLTLRKLNSLAADGFSDHDPILVQLKTSTPPGFHPQRAAARGAGGTW